MVLGSYFSETPDPKLDLKRWPNMYEAPGQLPKQNLRFRLLGVGCKALKGFPCLGRGLGL